MNTEPEQFKRRKYRRLSYRILFYVIFCSSVLTLLTTMFQLYLDYRKDVKTVYENIQLIEDSFLQSVVLSLYNIDENQLKRQLQGILKIRDIEYLEIEEPEGLHKTAGNSKAGNRIVHKTPLVYSLSPDRSFTLGTMTIVASLDGVYSRLWNKFLVSLISNAINTFIAAICIFLIIQFMITKHLYSIADYTGKLDLDRLDKNLTLKRKKSDAQKGDELDQVVGAINDMRVRLNEDMDVRREFEIQISEALDFREKIIKESPVGIAIYDETGQCISANNSIAQITGVSREEMVGQNINNLESWDRSGLLHAAEVAQKNNKSIRYEVALDSASGNQAYLDSYLVPFLSGDQVHLLLMANDISERIQAEKELTRFRNYLRNIIDSMPSVIVATNREEIVSQWNREAELTTGISLEKALGHHLGEIFPGLTAEMEKARNSIENLSPYKCAKLKMNLENEDRVFDMTIYPLRAGEDSGLEGVVIRMDNVTEYVKLEEMMIQSEKMLSIGGLAAGMAHEINNPLAGILQNLQVIKKRFSRDLEKNRVVAKECGVSMDTISEYMKRRNMLPMIDSVIEMGVRASKIVNNILSFSRKTEMNITPQDMGELLDSTVELAENDYDLKSRHDFRHIRIIREYNPDTPKVPCEKSKIQQVFFNILKNGAQAMSHKNKPDGEFIFIMRVKPSGSMVRVEIEDNGPGMDETIRKRVFEPFFTTKDVGVGTGLGLSVSYFIVTENHKGTMNVESLPGRGTRFIIELPLHREQ